MLRCNKWEGVMVPAPSWRHSLFISWGLVDILLGASIQVAQSCCNWSLTTVVPTVLQVLLHTALLATQLPPSQPLASGPGWRSCWVSSCHPCGELHILVPHPIDKCRDCLPVNELLGQANKGSAGQMLEGGNEVFHRVVTQLSLSFQLGTVCCMVPIAALECLNNLFLHWPL
jgi:hypothetical protein